jgi:hypothetical protein
MQDGSAKKMNTRLSTDWSKTHAVHAKKRVIELQLFRKKMHADMLHKINSRSAHGVTATKNECQICYRFVKKLHACRHATVQKK